MEEVFIFGHEALEIGICAKAMCLRRAVYAVTVIGFKRIVQNFPGFTSVLASPPSILVIADEGIASGQVGYGHGMIRFFLPNRPHQIQKVIDDDVT